VRNTGKQEQLNWETAGKPMNWFPHSCDWEDNAYYPLQSAVR